MGHSVSEMKQISLSDAAQRVISALVEPDADVEAIEASPEIWAELRAAFPPDNCEACRGAEDAPLPGVFYPTMSNGDTSVAWIERCDTCQRYASDEDAAKALVAAGKIEDYAMERPEGSESYTPFAIDAEELAVMPPWPR